jgi:SAM-dependent methyltransferase
MLHEARQTGHVGRLCGLDPAPGMLAQARKRQDVEWVLGDLTTVSWRDAFDLVVMTGHAFQVLVDDDDIRAALASIRSALTGDGRFAFETRNPSARAWERWTPDNAVAFADPTGATVRIATRIEAPFDGRTVSFSHTFVRSGWNRPQVSRSTLRFVDAVELDALLAAAGFVVEERYGSWDRRPLADPSPEIITIARCG